MGRVGDLFQKAQVMQRFYMLEERGERDRILKEHTSVTYERLCKGGLGAGSAHPGRCAQPGFQGNEEERETFC